MKLILIIVVALLIVCFICYEVEALWDNPYEYLEFEPCKPSEGKDETEELHITNVDEAIEFVDDIKACIVEHPIVGYWILEARKKRKEHTK